MTSFPEHAGNVLGVPGRFHNAHTWPESCGRSAGLFSTQTWTSEARAVKGYSKDSTLRVEIRFDDNCRNGQHSFTITGEIRNPRTRRDDFEAGGCLHDEIARVFPELAPLILWHLCDSAGPMHYPGNVLYLAGNRDCHGLLAGERRQIVNGRTKLPCWQLVAIGEDGAEIELYKLEKYHDSEQCPASAPRLEYRPWCRVGEGKARELDHARSSACWPEATDAELCAEPEVLRAALLARLPDLLVRFRAAIESAGFMFEVPSEVQS
jgi:hypothetical protein